MSEPTDELEGQLTIYDAIEDERRSPDVMVQSR